MLKQVTLTIEGDMQCLYCNKRFDGLADPCDCIRDMIDGMLIDCQQAQENQRLNLQDDFSRD